MLWVPRYLLPAMLVAACGLCFAYPQLWWGLIVLAPLTAIALLDFFQSRHALRRNYQLLARVRWLFEDLRPYLRSYIVEGDTEGRPFSLDERRLVYARAKGEIDSHPMGTELNVYSEEYEWLGHSIAPEEKCPKS